jgi:hypothetical protein
MRKSRFDSHRRLHIVWLTNAAEANAVRSGAVRRLQSGPHQSRPIALGTRRVRLQALKFALRPVRGEAVSALLAPVDDESPFPSGLG